MRAPVPVTAFQLANRFIGLHEVAGPINNPAICAMLMLDNPKERYDDETPWCSAFVGYVAWLLDLPRSYSLAARSWLNVGKPVVSRRYVQAFDVVVLQRGDGPQPGKNIVAAQGHVGFFAGYNGDDILVLGGNQGNRVSIAKFPKARVLDVREL